MSEKDDGKAAPEGAPAKAKVILPKVQKHQGGFHPGGAAGARGGKGKAQGQTHDRKPPRLPGRNG